MERGNKGLTTKNTRQNKDMYKLYDSYKESLKISKKVLHKRQKMNADIRENYEYPYKRQDHQDNVVDITHWNSMIGELEEDMKCIEMYLDFDDRVLLHRDYDNMKKMIYDQNSYEGEIPLDGLYCESVSDVADIVTDVELQEEIVKVLNDVLTEKQKQIISMYFWEGMSQDKIAKKLGLTQRGIGKIIENSLEILRNCIDFDDFYEN